MPRLSEDITVKNSQGLHARPAALFVQVTSRYNSSVSIEKDGEKVNGKSIMGILTLGVPPGATVTLEVEGDDAAELFGELKALLEKDVIE